MTESRVQIGISQDYLETEKLVNDAGVVHREVVHVANLPTDAFSRVRVSNPVGLFQNKNVMSRNRNQWEEVTTGTIIEHGSVTGGPFQVNDVVTFSPSTTLNPSGLVTAVNAGSVVVTMDHACDIVVGDTMTGSVSGATATTTSKDTGSLISHLPDEAAVQLQIGTASGDSATRHSHRYLPYVPGKSQFIAQTFDFEAAKTGVTNEVGYGHTSDGIFLERADDAVRLFIRSSASGSVVETNDADQSEWNIDTLSGGGGASNPSGIELDLSKAQILIIDFQWLGVGRVRCGFDIGGKIVYCHEFNHANTTDQVYMATPTLPIHYKIYNNAATASATTMKEICCSVASEGGFFPPGFEFSRGNSIRSRRAVTTRAPIFAIRLKNAYSADISTNRRTVKFVRAFFSTATQNAEFEIAHIHEPTSITATWADVGGGSGVEYSTDITAVTGNPEHVIDGDIVTATLGGKADGNELSGELLNLHGFLSQNFDSDNSQIFVVYATSETGTADTLARITWIEFD
jgi:hypothetical protein